MEETKILQQLAMHHLFMPLDSKQVKSVLNHSRILTFGTETMVFQKETPASAFFYILSGGVRLFFSSTDGKEKTVRIFQQGNSFAEALMFMGRDRYPANAMTTMPSQLLSIDSNFYRQMIMENTHLATALLAKCCEHIHVLSQQIEMLSVLDARSRFIAYLRQQLPLDPKIGHQLQITLSKKDLAEFLAIRPETLSRVIRQLEKEEILQWRQDILSIWNWQEF